MTFSQMAKTLVLCSVVLPACSSIHSEKIFQTEPDDWQMYGGGIGRTNSALKTISPPLTKLWEYNTGAGVSAYSGAIADSTFFVGTLIGEVHLIDIVTGKGIGSTDFGASIIGAPAVDKEIIYIPLSNSEIGLVAHNVRLAKNEWQVTLGSIESSPLLIGDKLLVTTLRGKLICLNKITGEQLWMFAVPPGNRMNMIHSSPATDGSLVFFGSDDGTLYAVDINDGKLRWKASMEGALMSSPSVSGGKVYIGSTGEWYRAFNAADGKIAWEKSLGANIAASQAVDDRHVYIGTTGRVFYCLNKDDGSVVWKYTANSLFNAAPFVAGEIVYIGCADKTLYAFRANTGELLWQLKTDGRIKTMPVAWKQFLIVMSEDDAVLGLTTENSK